MEKNSKEYKIFLRFCKDNDLLSILKRGQENRGFRVGSIFDQIFINQIFNNNITWNGTKEGFNFWYEIHLKWQIVCFENKIISKNTLLAELNFTRGREEIAKKYRKIWQQWNGLG